MIGRMAKAANTTSDSLPDFAGLMRRFERKVLGTAMRMPGNLEDAQDAAQEVFLRLYKYQRSFDTTREAAPWNLELTFHVLLAERGAGSPVNSPLPGDLESVAIQLRKVLGFSDVRLLESAVVRVRDGSGASVTGVLGGAGAAPAGYRLRFRGANVIGQADSTAVRLRVLEFSTRVQRETNGNFMDVSLETDVDVKAGQKAVVGNAGVDDQGRALVLVVVARVV